MMDHGLLLDASDQGHTAKYICPCGHEQKINKKDWNVDGDYFTTPLCPGCNIRHTTFYWHDAIAETRREKRVPVLDEDNNPRKVLDRDKGKIVEVTQTETWMEPDPDHPGAKQQVLCERIAKALDCKQQKRGSGKLKYPRAPKARREN